MTATVRAIMITRTFVLVVILWTSCWGVAESCQFGPGCEFECHCNGKGPCDIDTGECYDGCDLGGFNSSFFSGKWHGPGCQIGNVAYKKPATQVGALHGKHVAAWAVDGVTSRYSHNSDNSCAGPQTGELDGPPAWWQVDLGTSHLVSRIIILPRIDCCREHAHDIFVRVGDTSSIEQQKECTYIHGETDYVDHSFAPRSFTKDCDRPLTGRYVSLQRNPNATEPWKMLICEVYIEGFQIKKCPDGWWGPGCLTPCNCEVNCDGVLGQCPTRCRPGWKGDTCQESCNPKGRWGLGCNKECHCETDCHINDGLCPSRCKPGWSGRSCQTPCDDGVWGPLCNYTCNCVTPCDKEDGTCDSQCMPGWKGTRCQTEMPGFLDRPLVLSADTESITLQVLQLPALYAPSPSQLYYQLQYSKAWAHSWWQGPRQNHVTGRDNISMVVGGLKANTPYRMRVVHVLKEVDREAWGKPSDNAEERTLFALPPSSSKVTVQQMGCTCSFDQLAIIGFVVGFNVLFVIFVLSLLAYMFHKIKSLEKRQTTTCGPRLPLPNPTLNQARGPIQPRGPTQPKIDNTAQAAALNNNMYNELGPVTNYPSGKEALKDMTEVVLPSTEYPVKFSSEKMEHSM